MRRSLAFLALCTTFLGCLLRHGAHFYAVLTFWKIYAPHTPLLAYFAHQNDQVLPPLIKLSAQEVWQRTNYAAHVLRARAPQQNTSSLTNSAPKIALLARNHPDFVIVLIAALQMGVDVLLLNTAWSASELHRVLRSHGFPLLICDAEWQKRLDSLMLDGLALNSLLLDELHGHRSQPLSRPPHLLHSPHCRCHGAPILLTSGTTGTPKALRRRLHLRDLHRDIRTVLALLRNLPLRRQQRVWLTTPLFHGHGLSTLILSLLFGHRLFLHSATSRDEPDKLQEFLNQTDILVVVPTTFHRLLQRLPTQQHATSVPSTILCGSAPLSPQLVERSLKRFGPVLHNLYGTTETGNISYATPEMLLAAPDCVGRILSGVNVRISAQGEVLVWRAGTWHATGDKGRLSKGGFLWLEGRLDDVLTCGGETIAPELLERQIEQLPYVAECAVKGVSDEEYGQVLQVFLVLASGHVRPTDEALQNDWNRLFPRMFRPREWTWLSELPRNVIGKLRRKAL